MRKILLVLSFLIPVLANAQVINSQPQIYNKYVRVKGSLFSDSAMISSDSSNRVPNSAWIKRLTGSLSQYQKQLIPVNKTTSYTAAPYDFVLMSTAGSNQIVNLPNGPTNASLVGVQMSIQGGSNNVTIQGQSGATINGSTTFILNHLNEFLYVQYSASDNTWIILSQNVNVDLSGYVPTTTTVAGFPLTGNITLANLTNGYGLGTFTYNGSAPSTIPIDSTIIATKTFYNANTPTNTIARLATKLNIPDTAAMLAGYRKNITPIIYTFTPGMSYASSYNYTGSYTVTNYSLTLNGVQRCDDLIFQFGTEYLLIASPDASGNITDTYKLTLYLQ